jgi:hypothetical protein
MTSFGDDARAEPLRETIARIIWLHETSYEPSDDQMRKSVTGAKCFKLADAILALAPPAVTKAEPLRTSTPSFECLESALTAIGDKCTARGKTAIEPIIDFIERAIPLHPSKEAMMAAVELEIEAAIGKVQTRTIGRIIQKVIDAAAPPAVDRAAVIEEAAKVADRSMLESDRMAETLSYSELYGAQCSSQTAEDIARTIRALADAKGDGR